MRKVLFLLMLGLSTSFAQTNPSITEYIRIYHQLAMEEQMRTGIPAAITLAQGIHESGAGQGELALSSNNHFGIKCKTGWNGDKVFHDDDAAGECFRAYGSVADSYRDHSDFLLTGKRYGFLFELDMEDYRGWANGLKQAGYATNPKYPQIIIRIIEENKLDSYTSLALLNKAVTPVYTASYSQPAEPPKQQPATAASEKNKPARPTASLAAETPKPAIKTGLSSINECKVLLVEEGTTLSSIAMDQKISLKKLLEYNDIQTPDLLGNSQIIYLEPKKKKGIHKTYEVKPGDTAWAISQQEGIQLKKLLQQNKLTNSSTLQAGQVLTL